MKKLIFILIITVSITSLNIMGQGVYEEWKTPIQKAMEIPDSTIIGYDFITHETTNSRTEYSALNSKYSFLENLAEADMMIRGFDPISNLFHWVNCDGTDERCFNEQFLIKFVDTNRWVTRSDYDYKYSRPIYYISFRKNYLQLVLSLSINN